MNDITMKYGLPMGTPLWMSIETFTKYFEVSEKTVRRLIKLHPDFPVVRIGNKILISTIGACEWLDERIGSVETIEE